MQPKGASSRSADTYFLLGRLHGLPRRRIERMLEARGSSLAPRPSARVTAIAVGYSATARVHEDGRISLPAGLPEHAILISESEFRRRLGLVPAPPPTLRDHTLADLQKRSGLTTPVLSCLALFDIVEPVEERFGYRDLIAAREAAQLLSSGVALPRLIEAAVALARRGLHLSQARLTQDRSGELVREIAGQLAELGGQLRMDLASTGQEIDDILAAAEHAEATGDLAAAESLYATALRADASDPVIAFNLGNVLSAQGRRVEAKIAWRIAVARDPAIAEAWYNLAMAAEDEARTELAIAEYRRAIQAEPEYTDAHFNLALLLTKLERSAEALPLWERFLALAPDSPQRSTAKKAATLCRMKSLKAG